MRKIRYKSQKDINFQKRHQIRKWQKSLHSRKSRKRINIRNRDKNDKEKLTINLPSSFNILDNATDSISVINTLRAYVDSSANQRKLKKCSLDFSALEKLDVASALVLMAEIDMWREKWNQKLTAHTHTWNAEIHKFLKELGFFELIKPRETKPLVQHPNEEKITYLQVVRGQKSDGEKAKKLKENIEMKFKVGLSKPKSKRLYAALVESFMNAHRHAYRDSKYAYWWIVAAYRKQEKNLTVAVYDIGLGIPETMRKKRTEEVIQIISSIDSHLIEEAVKSSFYDEHYTRTTTGKAYHGVV